MMMKLLVTFILLAVFGAVAYADLENDNRMIEVVGESRLVERVKRSVEVHRDASDGTELVRRKREGFVTLVTNVFTGAFELAKKAAKAFLGFLQMAFKFLNKWIGVLIKVGQKHAKAVFKVADQVLTKFVAAVGWGLKRTFIIAGDLKNFFMKRVYTFLPRLKDNALKILTTIRDTLSNFYDTVSKYIGSVYSRHDKWEKENARLKALAEKEGGEKIKNFDDSFLNPPIDVSLDAFDKSHQAENLKDLGVKDTPTPASEASSSEAPAKQAPASEAPAKQAPASEAQAQQAQAKQGEQ